MRAVLVFSMTVGLGFASLSTPSLASDPLHLLAQVNHLVSQDTDKKLEDIAAEQKKKTGTSAKPKRPQ